MTEQVFESAVADRELMADADLMAVAIDLTSACQESRLARLKVIQRLDSTEGYRYDGFTSVTSFLVARCGMGVGEANREVFLARTMVDMPYATKLAEDGRLTIGQLETLAHAQSRHPDAFAADEPTLAEAATGLDPSDTRRLVEYWAQAHDHSDDGEVEPSRVFLSSALDGRGRLDGDLDPEMHALMKAALDPLITELVHTTPARDRRPTPELRGEALAQILRQHLDSNDAPTDHGNRPHLTVVVDWQILRGEGRSGLSELGDGTVIRPEAARRLACDANVCRLLTGPNSEILDLGQTRRTVSPAQWKALRVRDRTCRFPGCRRPWYWTDAHHRIPWSRVQETTVDGLILLCRHHHILVHEGGWRIEGPIENLTFIRPDGTVLATGPP